ncbi:hypothetical protein P153DRAFT_435615 [Dothidotthia symphoricarpi CBS 119687]|uniref:Uncharacterized protein n=1 Tax=Dothidotthia symphoricarpi CBS 119687 TaxID=1392245 RepID=A0A6A5ZYP9_9PLEO|nr:uncharacterized protein P153DRAFT_435615 [Dothidotthia symphoricarpi CBS 119687]KAF2124003.1 hypothetical protein P153DRAFT_435615 [Dothidotthia symphoricarpi CBS 119687]
MSSVSSFISSFTNTLFGYLRSIASALISSSPFRWTWAQQVHVKLKAEHTIIWVCQIMNFLWVVFQSWRGSKKKVTKMLNAKTGADEDKERTKKIKRRKKYLGKGKGRERVSNNDRGKYTLIFL